MTERKEIELRKLIGFIVGNSTYVGKLNKEEVVVFRENGISEMIEHLLYLYDKLDERNK